MHATKTLAGIAFAVCSLAFVAPEKCLGSPTSPWNNPYPAADSSTRVYYDSFDERPKHLDPALSYSENEAEIIGQIYEPPLQYDYLQRPYKLQALTVDEVPAAQYFDSHGQALPSDVEASAVAWSIYRFHLRPGVRYQPHPCFARLANGELRYAAVNSDEIKRIHTLADFAQTDTREVTAEDYVYAVKRIAHPAVPTPIAEVMFEHIAGMRDYAAKLQEAYRANQDTPAKFFDLRPYDFDGVRLIDRYTWELKVFGKYPQFLYWQAMSFFAPMPWEADRFYSQPGLSSRNITLDWYPVGSGPFMLEENNPNRRMVLAHNPNFHFEAYPTKGEAQDAAKGLLADAGKPMPFVDRAVYTLETESIPRWSKFLQGYYDASGISSDNFDQVVQASGAEATLTDEMQSQGISLVTDVSATTSYTGFNMLDPVVGGLSPSATKLRQAIAIAVDMEEFVSIFRNGRGIASQGPIPPGLFGAKEGREAINPMVYDWVDGHPQRKSLQTARDLLTQAGYPNGRDAKTGKPLVLYLDTPATGPDSKPTLEWWRKQFAKLDIQLVIRDSDYNRFQDKMRQGNAQIYQWGWNADYPDPENFLSLLVGKNGKVKYQGENASNYENAEFDRLFDLMRSMDNGPERQRIIDEMVAIVRRDGPWLWGFHPIGYGLQHQWVSNVKPNLMARNTLKYLRVDATSRKQLRESWNSPVWWPLLATIFAIILSVIPATMAYRRRQRARAL